MDGGAHFGVVAQGEVVDGVGVGGAVGGVGGEGGGEGGGAGLGGMVVVVGIGIWDGIDAVGIEHGEEDADVFEPGVHALAVKRNHSVGGVAEDDDAGGEVVGGAFYGDEGEMGGGCELGD